MKTFDIQLTDNFTLSEFLTTTKDFDNFSIPVGHFYNILNLASILQKIRNQISKPIRISSGYRPEKLNTMVDGVKNSYHLVGAAADVYFNNKEDYESAWKCARYLFEYYAIIDIAELLGCPDQFWFHISINNSYRPQKRVINSNFY